MPWKALCLQSALYLYTKVWELDWSKCMQGEMRSIIRKPNYFNYSSGLELLRVKLCTKTKTTKNDVEGNTG